MRIIPVTQFNFHKKEYKNAVVLPNFRAKGDTKKLGKIIENSSSLISGITAGFAMKNYITYDSAENFNGRSDDKLEEKQNEHSSSHKNVTGELSGETISETKLTHKELEQFILEQYNDNPPLFSASKTKAHKIRQTFMDNNLQEYLLNLYVKDNDTGKTILTHNLENFDLSALPALIESLNSQYTRPEAQNPLADEILYFLYNFIFDNADKLEDNEFSKDLENYINILKAKLEQNNYTGMHNVFYTQKMKTEFRGKYSDESVKSELAKKLFGPLIKTPVLENYNDINEIEDLLNSKEIQNYYGSTINFNDKIVNSIADIVPTKANKKQYDRIIELLKRLPLIDYNRKDEFDISVIEKILNAENYELLDVVKDKNVKYLPELDVVYNNIQDNKFKKLVDTVNFNVDELISIIRKEDKTRLPLLDKYLTSPMILNNINIRERLIYEHERSSYAFATYLADTYPYIFR